MMCNKLRWGVLAVGLVSFGAVVKPSIAVPAVYFDRDDTTGFMSAYPNSQAKFNQFTSALSVYSVESVDTLSGSNPPLTFGGTGITATSQGVVAQSNPGFQIGAKSFLEADAQGSFSQVDTVFTFNKYITAFGLYVMQAGDAANNNPITFRLRDTAANSFVDVTQPVGPGWGFDNAFFFGVTDSTAFNEVQLLETGDVNDGSLYDNIVAGSVPEPASFVLMMFGGACTLGRRFRRS